MYYYRFSLESPEGIDCIYEFMHEKKFSNKEFDAKCFEAIKEAFTERMSKRKEKYIALFELDGFDEKMAEEGFKKSDRKLTASAYWCPWGSDDPDTNKLVEKIQEYNNEVGIM